MTGDEASPQVEAVRTIGACLRLARPVLGPTAVVVRRLVRTESLDSLGKRNRVWRRRERKSRLRVAFRPQTQTAGSLAASGGPAAANLTTGPVVAMALAGLRAESSAGPPAQSVLS